MTENECTVRYKKHASVMKMVKFPMKSSELNIMSYEEKKAYVFG